MIIQNKDLRDYATLRGQRLIFQFCSPSRRQRPAIVIIIRLMTACGLTVDFLYRASPTAHWALS